MICKVCNKELNEFYINDLLGIKKHTLCYACFNEFPFINEITNIDKFKCLSLYSYKGIIKELIYQLKGLKDYEIKDVFIEYFKDWLNDLYKGYTITFVPSFHLDDDNRGFNHVEVIFSLLNNKKVKLFTKKYNYKQSDQKYSDRKNINHIITLNKSNLKGLKKVLIVDDVLTSGNSLKTCASLLYKEGVKDIKFLTISKVVEK